MPETPEQDLGVEGEIGATSGDTHDKVLEKALGHERGQRAALSDGPGMPRKRKG